MSMDTRQAVNRTVSQPFGKKPHLQLFFHPILPLPERNNAVTGAASLHDGLLRSDNSYFYFTSIMEKLNISEESLPATGLWAIIYAVSA